LANKGVAPADLTTDIGKLRRDLGDLVYKELTPPEVGYGDYAFFSDDELASYLDDTDNRNRIVGNLYLVMAGIVARESQLIKTFDLTRDNTKAPEQLRLIAKEWFAKADEEDALINVEDSFIISSTGRKCHCRIPEASLIPTRCGRC
jgi:hypothetical protein